MSPENIRLLASRGFMFNYTTLNENDCEFYAIAPAAELPNGERLFVDIGDTPVVIFNIGNSLFAIKDQCSHEDLDIGEGDLTGHELACPHHGAVFDVRSGAALTLPAVDGIPAYPVRVQGGMIEVGLPKGG